MNKCAKFHIANSAITHFKTPSREDDKTLRDGQLLCTTLYRKPSEQLWWHIWPIFLWNFCAFFLHNMNLSFLELMPCMVEKSQRWPKSQIKGSCLNQSPSYSRYNRQDYTLSEVDFHKWNQKKKVSEPFSFLPSQVGRECTKTGNITLDLNVGVLPSVCSRGYVYDKEDGLCYPPCPENTHAVGPVCWPTYPRGGPEPISRQREQVTVDHAAREIELIHLKFNPLNRAERTACQNNPNAVRL